MFTLVYRTCLVVCLVLLFFVSTYAQKARLVIPTGHTNPVVSIALNYQEKILATADQTSSIKIWDRETKNERYAFTGHTEGVNDVAFSPITNLLASASNDKTVILWNLQRAAKQSSLIGHTDVVSRVLFTLDGASLVSSSFDGTVKIWDVATGSLKREIKVGNPIHSIRLNKEEEYLVCGTRSGELLVLDFQTGQKLKSIALGVTLHDIQFSEDEKNVLVSDNLGKVTVINFGTSAILHVIQAFAYRAYKISATETPDVFLVVGRDPKKNIAMFNYITGKLVNHTLEEAVSPGFETGINTVLYNKEKSAVFIPNYTACVREITTRQSATTALFCGKAKAITSCSIDESGRFLAVASNRAEVLILDLTGATDSRVVQGHQTAVRTIAFHPTQKKFITASDDATLKIWDTESWTQLSSYPVEAPYAGTAIYFDSPSQGFYKKTGESVISFFPPDKVKAERINLKNVFDYRVSPDGNTIVAKTANTLSFYAHPKFSKPVKVTLNGVADYEYISNNQLAVLDGTHIRLFNTVSRKEEKSFPLTVAKGSNRIKVIPEKQLAITWNTSAGKFGASQDHAMRVWNLTTGELITSLEGHTGAITSISLLQNKFVFSSSTDGTVRIWSLDQSEHSPYQASLIPLHDDNWAVTTGSGLFDATADAMHVMHYVQGAEIVDIDQLKHTYYEPALLPKLLGYNNEPIRKAKELSELVLYPEINLLHPSLNGGMLGIELSDQGGGYGQVIILINDKEIVQDLLDVMPVDKLNPEISLSYSVAGHPNLKEGDLNKVSVKAYNKSGDLVSRPKNVYILPDASSKKPQQKLFALIVGVSDYQGTQLDLKFAAKDAADIAEALRISADHYLGQENTEITLLNTDQVNPLFKPTKPNIKRVLDGFSKRASSSDILFVYLAGHGVNYGGEDGDFYYLTSDAKNALLADEHVRATEAISSEEFTDLIKKIPAVRQVMIIDACYSGQLASNLSKTQASISSSQVRAMETMKDKTGLYVLAGSASDAVSYETSSYGQGILTYSLLFGIKGPALRENEFVDIVKLFQFATNKVPQLAAGLGGIQKPEIRIPSEATSFDIGKLTEETKNQIILAQPKPVFIRSEFQEETQLFDVSDLSTEVDAALKIRTAGGSGDLDFIDTRKFSDGYTLRGRYVQKENELTVKVRMFKDDKPVHEFEEVASSSKELAQKIVADAVKKAVSDN